MQIKGDMAALQQPEPLRQAAFLEEPVPGPQRGHPASPGEGGEVAVCHAAKEGMLAQFRRCHAAHGAPSSAAASGASARSAATSSVMSMPTGHHTMHRPHPTQPELPNWSCQVPSLWVSHCRYRLLAEARTGPPWI